MSTGESLQIFPLTILRNLTQISFLGLPSRPGATRPLFDLLERYDHSLKFLLEGCSDNSRRDLIVCITREALSHLQDELDGIKERMQPQHLVIRQPVAVVRMLGPHFDLVPGVSGLLFSTLAKAAVQVLSNATTITSSSCVIPEDQVEVAVRAIGRVFDIPKRKR
jgi:aspartokinase